MDEAPSWYLAEGGKTLGPFSKAQVVEQLQAGKATKSTVGFRHGTTAQWTPLGQIPEFATAVSATAKVPEVPRPVPPPAPLPAPAPSPVPAAQPPVASAPTPAPVFNPPPAAGPPAPATAAVPAPASPAVAVQVASKQDAGSFEYQIVGAEAQCIEVELEPGASVLGDPAMLVCCDGDVSIEDSESAFLPSFNNRRPSGRAKLVFGGLVMGGVTVLDLKASGGALWCCLDALLCCEGGVTAPGGLKTIPGSAPGVGIVLHRLEGKGLCFLQGGGRVLRRRLVAGESVRVDAACLLACEGRVEIDIQHSGEGPRLALLKGPGVVWLQSHSSLRLAARIRAAARPAGGS